MKFSSFNARIWSRVISGSRMSMDRAPPSPEGDDRLAATRKGLLNRDGRLRPHRAVSPATMTKKRKLKPLHFIPHRDCTKQILSHAGS
jgi:hypothetical protein